MLTNKPSCMTKEQHQLAEQQGWSIFNHNGISFVERIDELNLISDIEAIVLAQKMGLDVGSDGIVRDEIQVTYD